jgi:hypothetical protein
MAQAFHRLRLSAHPLTSTGKHLRPLGSWDR